MERFADPETGTGFSRVGLLRVANTGEAVRDPSTAFALLTPVRMTTTAHESKNSQPLGMTKKALSLCHPEPASPASRVEGSTRSDFLTLKAETFFYHSTREVRVGPRGFGRQPAGILRAKRA